jgi:hypothetical protein
MVQDKFEDGVTLAYHGRHSGAKCQLKMAPEFGN